MANKWIQWVKQWAADKGVKYAVALGDPECKASYKKGAGLFDDVKKVALSGAKSLVKKGIDMGADKLKQVVGEGKGKGILGDIIKTVGNATAVVIPMPNVVRNVGKTVANYAVDKSGLGVKKPRKKRGAALFP